MGTSGPENKAQNILLPQQCTASVVDASEHYKT